VTEIFLFKVYFILTKADKPDLGSHNILFHRKACKL